MRPSASTPTDARIVRQLHLLRRPGDTLAREVIQRQLASADEVHVVLLLGAAVEAAGSLPDGVVVFSMPPLQYDELVEQVAWSERVVSW